MNRSLALSLSFSLPLAAACGGNAHHSPDAMPDQTSQDAMPAPFAVAVTGDFKSTGTLATLDPVALTVMPKAVAGVAGDDPFLRKFGDELFIINRSDGNNVTILNATTLALVEQLATGAGSNPQDVAVHGQQLYVPALGTAGVVVLTRGSTTTTTIDLSTVLGAVGGKPDCVSAYTVGDRVFVACDLLDRNFKPTGPGKVAVIDATTNSVVASFALPYANPQNMFVQTPATSMYGGDLLIATVPDFQNYATGCLARVSTGATPAANGCALTNMAAGGFQSHSDVQLLTNGGAQLWMAITSYDASFNASGKLRRLDLTTGQLDAAAVSPPSELIVDVAVCPENRIVAADQTMGASGLRVYDGPVERTTMALSIGLPPAFGNNTVCYDR